MTQRRLRPSQGGKLHPGVTLPALPMPTVPETESDCRGYGDGLYGVCTKVRMWKSYAEASGTEPLYDEPDELTLAQRKYIGQSYLIDENDSRFGLLIGRIHNVTRDAESGRLMIWFTIPRYGSSGAEYVENLEANEAMRWFQTRGAR